MLVDVFGLPPCGPNNLEHGVDLKPHVGVDGNASSVNDRHWKICRIDVTGPQQGRIVVEVLSVFNFGADGTCAVAASGIIGPVLNVVVPDTGGPRTTACVLCHRAWI